MMGVFNHPSVCWESNTAGYKQSRRLLEYAEDNFPVQLLGRPIKGEVLPDLVLINAEIIKEVKIGGSLGYGDHALVEFVMWAWQRAESRP